MNNDRKICLRSMGCIEEYKDLFIGLVHVEDVALAHITLFENPAASRRHLCVEPICHFAISRPKSRSSTPTTKLPEDTQLGLVRVEAVPKKLMALGLHFTPLEKIIKDAVESLRRRGCIA
ncbi:hypothetical protein VPH35_003170 [Triticum aestivum]